MKYQKRAEAYKAAVARIAQAFDAEIQQARNMIDFYGFSGSPKLAQRILHDAVDLVLEGKLKEGGKTVLYMTDDANGKPIYVTTSKI